MTATCRSILCALFSASALLVSLPSGAEEYKTEFVDAAGAMDAGWEAIPGELPDANAPELTVTTDAAVGATAVRVEVTNEGPWQGIQLQDSIDLREYAGLEFYIRQNIRTTAPEWTCCVQVFFEGGGTALATPKMGTGAWTRIYLPLQSPPWELSDRPEGWGKTTRIRFYPYRAMDTPGELMEIDGLRLVPRSEDPTAHTQGMTCTFENPPVGDAKNAALIILDGELSKDAQVTWPAYGGDPRIVLDLGEEQTLTKVRLKAFASPAQNIAGATVEVSPDAEAWEAACSLVNESTQQSEGEHTLSATCLSVGRYVRITLKRPRVDVPLVLGEIALSRRATVAADREAQAAVYFDGPEMPPVPADLTDNEEYAILRGQKATVAIHRKTGILGGLWADDGRRIMLRGWDRYVFENRDALVESAEYADTTVRAAQSGGSLVIVCTNADLPDLTIEKRYSFADDGQEEWLAKTTVFKYTGGRPDQFATLLTNAALDEQFRKGGYYETAQVRCDRLPADSVHFTHVVPASKAVMLVRPGSLATVTQYRQKVNDRFCLPNHGQHPMEPYNRTSYNRSGWEIGHATLKLSGEEVASTQVHTALVEGGRFGWERHFVSLPDYRQYMRGLDRPSWLGDIKTITVDSYKCGLWDHTRRTAQRLAKVFSSGLTVAPSLTHLDGVWGDLPVSGDAIGLFGAVTPTDEIARQLEALQSMPQRRAGLYMWLTSVGRESRVFNEHPEWFAPTNKAGEPRVVFPQLKANFARMMSIPEQQDFLVKQVVELHKRYPQDVWYLDGGNTTVNLIDWEHLRTTQDYHGEDFCRRVRNELRELNPDVAVFFNSADDRLADIGFAEIGRQFGKEWRRAAARMYSCKVRQYFDRDRPMSPLYWIGSGDTYLRICTALGFPPSGPGGLSTKSLLTAAPYCTATFETRGLQFSPTRYRPDWRFDEDTPLEMYALRTGPGLVISTVAHRNDERSERIAAEVPPDVAGPGQTVYVAHHVMKSIGEYSVPGSDFASAASYRETGWATGAVTELRTIRPITVDEEGWISFEAALPPGLLNVFSVVRAPVYFWSRDGLRANFLLPAVHKDALQVTPDTDGLTVTVMPSDEPREILALAPTGRSVGSADVGGEAATSRPVMLHGLHAAVISIPPAATDTSVAIRFGDLPAREAPPNQSVADKVQAGDVLNVEIDATQDSPLLSNVWRDGTLVFAGELRGPQLHLPVPVQAHNGEYEIEVAYPGSPPATAKFTVTGHQATDSIPSEHPPIERNLQVTPLDVTRGDVQVLGQGTLEYGHCRPTVDLDALTIRADVPRECATYYAQSMAGVELRGARQVAVTVDHNMYPVRGLYPDRHVLYETHANAFIGFFIDYATPEGYTKRVALSAGKMSTKRASAQPEWGAARAPDQYLRLPSTIYTGERVAGILDLGAWAPTDWDGRVWISAIMDLALPSRWLSMTLRGLNPAADSEPAIPIEDVSGRVSQVRDRTIEPGRFDAPPTLDGKLDDPCWGLADPERGLFVVAEEGQPASAETEIRVGYDAENIYIAVTAWEKEKTGFETTNGAAGRPWWDDAVEFALAPPDWQGRFLHQIVTADAVTYQETVEIASDKRRKSELPVICKATKYPDRFTVEAAVPIAASGITAPAPGARWKAQFMRTRVLPSGRREHATWTPTDAFHDHSAFGTIEFR